MLRPSRIGLVVVLVSAPWCARSPEAAALSPIIRVVNDIKALHRAGQTFITWRGLPSPPEKFSWGQAKDISEVSELTYRIYVHDERITDSNLSRAKLLGQAGPLSGYNLNARNVEYLIGQAMIKPDSMGELTRGYNGFIYRWHMDHPRMLRYPLNRFVIDEKAAPLGPDAGLYVHQPAKPGNRYYAVLAFRRERRVEQRIRGGENSLREPVAETVGAGEPVCQGDGLWGPFFDYPGKRKVYVQWTAPPLSPRPNMYFNWSVLVPPDVKGSAPVELYFHSGNYSYAKPNAKYIAGSVQIAPHDYPFSGWHGYNSALAAGKEAASGRVSNHTQKRIAAFMEWAKKKFPIDPSRIIAVGGDGAAAMALVYPDMFAYVLITGFEGRLLNRKATRQFVNAWGPKDVQVCDDKGRGEWAWAELDKLVLAEPARDLPLFICKGASWGRAKGWGIGRGRLYSAMHEARQPLYAHWAWGGNLAAPDRYTGLWRGLDIRSDTPVPGIANSSADKEGEGHGHSNTVYSWKDIKDEPNSFQITITGRESTFDLTPRRLQKFEVKPGERLAWEVVALPGRGAKPAPPQTGRVIADKYGLVTLEKLKLSGGGLAIKITRAE